MRRVLTVVAASAALLITATPMAFAQETGPNTAACETAAVEVRDAAEVVVLAGDAVAAAQAQVLAGLQADVEEADLALEAALAALVDPGLDMVELAEAEDAVVAAVLQLRRAIDALEAAADPVVPAGLTDALAEAQLALQVAIDARVAACAAVLPPAETPPGETPGREPFANCDLVRDAGLDAILEDDPLFQAGLDRDGDGVGCEPDDRDVSVGGLPPGGSNSGSDGSVRLVPSDAPETGDGSTEVSLPMRLALAAALLNLAVLVYARNRPWSGLRL